MAVLASTTASQLRCVHVRPSRALLMLVLNEAVNEQAASSTRLDLLCSLFFFPFSYVLGASFHLYSPISQCFVCVCECVSGVYVRCTLYLDVVGMRSFSFPSLLFLSSCLPFPLLIFTRLTSIRYTRTLQPDRRTRLQFLGFFSFYISTSCVSISTCNILPRFFIPFPFPISVHPPPSPTASSISVTLNLLFPYAHTFLIPRSPLSYSLSFQSSFS